MLLTWVKVTVINFAEGGVHTASTKKLNSDFMPPHHHTFINTEEDDPAEHAVDKIHECQLVLIMSTQKSEQGWVILHFATAYWDDT